MTISYQIDGGQHLVRVLCADALTSPAIIDLRTRLLVDPEFSSSFALLFDLGDTTDVRIESSGIVGLADTPLFERGARRAIVARADAVYGLARMYAAHAQERGQGVEVFRSVEDAERWLGVHAS